MKAILNYNDFTKMIDVQYPHKQLHMFAGPPSRALTAYSNTPIAASPTVKKWIFELVDITIVDGEQIACYDFYEEEK